MGFNRHKPKKKQHIVVHYCLGAELLHDYALLWVESGVWWDRDAHTVQRNRARAQSDYYSRRSRSVVVRWPVATTPGNSDRINFLLQFIGVFRRLWWWNAAGLCQGLMLTLRGVEWRFWQGWRQSMLVGRRPGRWGCPVLGYAPTSHYLTIFWQGRGLIAAGLSVG